VRARVQVRVWRARARGILHDEERADLQHERAGSNVRHVKDAWVWLYIWTNDGEGSEGEMGQCEQCSAV